MIQKLLIMFLALVVGQRLLFSFIRKSGQSKAQNTPPSPAPKKKPKIPSDVSDGDFKEVSK